MHHIHACTPAPQGMNYVAAVLVSEALEFDESLDDLSGRQVVKTYSYLDSKVTASYYF